MRAVVLLLAVLWATGAEASTLAAPDSLESAVILALELSPELLPPPGLVAALREDLAAINTYDGFFAQFRAVPNRVPGSILVGLTDSAWSEHLAGQYHGLDALNQQYGPVHIDVLSFIKVFSLDFDQPYNPPALASLYAGATGVRYVEPNSMIGDPSTDIASTTLGQYVYTQGWDDCPSGCLHHYQWEFQVTGGTVTLLRSWGDPVPVPPPIPAAPVATTGTSVGSTSFTANWNVSSDATSYRLDVSTSSGFGTYVTGYQDLTFSGLSQAVSGLTASTTYYYRVRAVNESGTSGNSNTITVTTSAPALSHARISQVYGGGGSSGYYKCDYIELFNNSNAPVNIGGWSVQYASSSGASFGSATYNLALIPSGATIPACGYYLITGYCSTAGADLPVTPDLARPSPATWTFNFGVPGGKVALFSDQVTGRTCAQARAAAVDLVGYGAANCYETAAAPALDASSVLVRGSAGAVDTDNNSTDFSKIAEPWPMHNSASAANPACQGSAPPNAPALLGPPDGASEVAVPTSLSVTVSDSDADALTVQFYGRAAPADFALLGTVAGVPSASDAVFQWSGLDPLTQYEWYVKVGDGHTVDITGPTWSFTPASPSTGVEGPAYGGLALASPAPNPTRGEGLTVAFTLPTATPARLELLDVSGRRVVEREVGSLGAGQHTLDLGQGQHLAPGLYLVRLTQGANTRTTRVAVLR